MRQPQKGDGTSFSEHFVKHGFFIVPQLISEDECEVLKSEAVKFIGTTDHSESVLVGAAAKSPMFYKLASHPGIVQVLKQIMPDGIMFLSDKVVYKSKAKSFPTPWHTDAQYWPGTRPKLSVWIALDNAHADNGALKVVRGSHRFSWKPGQAKTSETNGEFGRILEGDQWTAQDELTCEVDKGSAIIFHDRLIHGSCPNTSGKERFSIISTYHGSRGPEEDMDKDFPARHVIVP